MPRNPEQRSFRPVTAIRVAAVASLALLSACGSRVLPREDDQTTVKSSYKDWHVECQGSAPYKVKPGDTVFTILNEHTVLNDNNRSWQQMPPQAAFEAVEELNPQIPDANHIKTDSRIRIPLICSPSTGS